MRIKKPISLLFLFVTNFVLAKDDNKYLEKQNKAFLIIENRILSTLIDETVKSLKHFVENEESKSKFQHEISIKSVRADKITKTITVVSVKGESVVDFTPVLSNKIIIDGQSYSLDFDKSFVLIKLFSFFIKEAYAQSEEPQILPILKLKIKDYLKSTSYQDGLTYSLDQCELHRRELALYYEPGFKSEKELSGQTRDIITTISTNSVKSRCVKPMFLEEEVCQASRELVECEDKFASEKVTIQAKNKDERNNKPEEEEKTVEEKASPAADEN